MKKALSAVSASVMAAACLMNAGHSAAETAAPAAPASGTISLIAVGIIAVLAGTGLIIFMRKKDK